MKIKRSFGIIILIIISCSPNTLNAQENSDIVINKPIVLLLLLAGLSLAPFILMMMTSFVKISVVLSILRSALGTQQIPPSIIIMGISLVLTIYIMMPVSIDAKKAAEKIIMQQTGKLNFSEANIDVMIKAAEASKEPIKKFLSKNAHKDDKYLFYKLSLKLNKDSSVEFTEEDLIILIPAFVISQLKEAFQIGFIIYLPFLIIDIVVSNILLSMGMFMLSPTTISLPFKLLLFILVDGWYLIARGLVLGYIN